MATKHRGFGLLLYECCACLNTYVKRGVGTATIAFSSKGQYCHTL